jgi:hypothetical protein
VPPLYQGFEALIRIDTGEVLAARAAIMFDRVFLQHGVPAWPNGFDVDAIALHWEMDAAGLLVAPLAA